MRWARTRGSVQVPVPTAYPRRLCKRLHHRGARDQQKFLAGPGANGMQEWAHGGRQGCRLFRPRHLETRDHERGSLGKIGGPDAQIVITLVDAKAENSIRLLTTWANWRPVYSADAFSLCSDCYIHNLGAQAISLRHGPGRSQPSSGAAIMSLC